MGPHHFRRLDLRTGRQFKLLKDGMQSNMTPFRIREMNKLGFEWELRSSTGWSTSSKPDICESTVISTPLSTSTEGTWT
jgi:hypothetical protein